MVYSWTVTNPARNPARCDRCSNRGEETVSIYIFGETWQVCKRCYEEMAEKGEL